MTDGTYQAIAMIIYFVAMLAIGGWAYLRTDNFDDYMLADRDLNPWVAALSAGASDMSGWLLMGLPGALYASGLVGGWIAIGLTIGALANWLLVAPRLRAYTEVANNSITVPSFLDNRLHDTRRLLRWSSGLIILVYFTFYVSSGMVAGGRFFESSFGIMHVGGLGNLVKAVSEVDPHYWAIWGPTTTIIGVISALAWGLGYFGQPHIIVRFMAIRSPKEAVAGGTIGIGWMLFAVLGAAGTAIAGVAVYQHDKSKLADPETVFIALGKLLFHPLVAGFMLAAILAAIMSTISSQLLVTSSALIEDLYGSMTRTRGGDVSGNRMVLYSRMAVFAIALVAAVMAWNPSKTILDLVAFAWAGFGASFGPTILLSLYWRRLSAMGAFIGMITGAVIVMVWGNVSGGPGGIFDLYEIVPGFLGNLAVAWAVSRTSRPSEEISQEFEAAVAAART